MPMWDDITKDEEFQKLPEEARASLKSQWFQHKLLPIVKSDPVLKEMGEDNIYQWFMQQPDDSGQGYASSLLGSAGRGFAEVVPGAIEGAGALVGSEGMRRAGQSLRSSIEEISPVNPVHAESFPVKASGAVGQAVSMLGTGGVGGAIGKGLGGVSKVAPAARAAVMTSAGLQGAAGGAQEAERYGITGPQAYARTLLGAATELGTEALPFGTLAETQVARSLLSKAPRTVGATGSTLSEMAEEGTNQLASNLATRALVPEGVQGPDITEGVGEATALGGVGGLTMGGVNALVSDRPSQEAPPVVSTTDQLVQVNGVTIATIPAGSQYTPEQVLEFYEDSPDTLKALARNQQITLPEVLPPVEGVDTSAMDENIAASAALAPGTVDALKATTQSRRQQIQTRLAEIEKQYGPREDVVIGADGFPTRTKPRRINTTEEDALLKEIEELNATEQVSPVTTETETPVNAANVDGGSQSVQTEPAEGSIPAVTEDIVPSPEAESTEEIQPTQTDALNPVEQQESLRGEPAEGDQSRETAEPSTGDSLRNEAEESGQDQVEWSARTNEPAAFTVNGQPVVGTVQTMRPDGKAEVTYPWNGKTQTTIVPAGQLQRPVASLAAAPRYQYTQEQNARKAGKHVPVEPGLYRDFDFRRAFNSMANDTSLSRFYRMVAHILAKKPEFSNVDFHVVADGRKKAAAGEYSFHNGRAAIAVNLRQVGSGQVDAVGTILHEALHHETLAKVRNPDTQIEREAVAAIDQIRQQIQQYAEAQGKGDRFSYELGSNEEFISGLFTRPDFQNFLASIPENFGAGTTTGKFRSMLAELFRRIAELVTGVRVPKGSPMEQAMTSMLTLFETPHRAEETGGLRFLSAAGRPVYRTPSDVLAEAAAKLRGEQAVEKPAGLNKMFNPVEGRPATGERRLFDTPQQPKTSLGDLTTAYQKALPGRSTAWVPIKEVYANAKEENPDLTPEEFMQQVNEQNDSGGIYISPVEQLSTVEAARPFVVGGAGVEMLVPTGTALSQSEEPAESMFRETRARFAPPKYEDRLYEVHTDKEAVKKAFDWINAVSPERAADLLMSGRAPGWMDQNIQTIAVAGLLNGFADISTDTNASEDERTVARATNQRLGKFWVSMGQDAARSMRQRAIQNGRILQPIAAILATEQVLADRGEKVLEKQIDGGSEGAVPRVTDAADRATAEADERLENIISRLMGSMSPKLTARGAVAKMFRGKGQRDQIIDEVAKALMLKARGNVVTPERKTALANLVSSLKGTLAANVKGEKIPAPQQSMQDLLTSAFVNQVSEGPAFEEAWKEGRQKVLDMLTDMELDKAFHPAEKRMADARAKLRHLEAGNEAQQKASAAEMEQLRQQIEVEKAAMKSAMDAVKAMTPQLEAQRDNLMPSAAAMAFNPAAAKEAISRAFEKAGYNADIATGLDKSGKRSLSIKDALLNRTRAKDAVMKVFDEEMKNTNAATQNDWPQARATALKAVNDTLDSWQKQMDEDRAAKQDAKKAALLSEDSKALEKLVNSIRAKIAPDESWSDILHDLPKNQKERLDAIKDRVTKHEALKNLTQDEKDQLAKSVDKLWQRERLKAFQDELLKAGVLKAKTQKAAANVMSAAPELLRLMNLGVFNSSTFREAVAKRFGLKTLSSTQAAYLRKLAADAWDTPQGVLRNKKLKELVEGLQHVTGNSWSDTMNSYWTASVLSGLRTHFDTWMAVINGLGTNFIQSGALLARGKGAEAAAAHAQWWKGLFSGMNEALHILRTGDPSSTKRFEADLIRALDGEKGAHPISIGEKLWKEGNFLQKIPGALMIAVGRSMMAADHVNNTATTQGAMAVARAMNPELYGGKSSFTQKEWDDARKQAIAETTAGAEPSTSEENATVSVRTREILNRSLEPEHQMQASEVGDIAAFQNDPTGLFGGIYHMVKAGLGWGQRKLEENAQDEEAAKITRAIAAVFAASIHAITGTRFMRFGFNLGNEFIRYMPGSWLLNKGTNILGKNLSPMQNELLIGKNLVGAMALATLHAMFGGDDEDKEGEWHMEGDWSSLSDEDKVSRMSSGKQPRTFWKVENGQIRRVAYSQWPLAGLIAAAGDMHDQRRYNPEEWKKRGAAEHILRGAQVGLFQLQNAAALQQLAELFSKGATHGGDPQKTTQDRLIKMGINMGAGMVPTFLKDLDKWDDPRNYRPDGVWEKMVREMPIARRYVDDGRPQFNRLGDDVRVHREPYSRLTTSDKIDEPTRLYGEMLARGVDFPDPSTDRKIVKGGKKVPMESLGKGVVYDFEKAVALDRRKFLEKHGEKLSKLPTKALSDLVKNYGRAAIDREAAKVQASVNKK